MFRSIPEALWLILIALNIFMIMLNVALDNYEWAALNAGSGLACYLAYYTSQNYGGTDGDS